MKQRIPHDVERLMWLVAESNDPSAIADFESRFPEFAPELARRRRMVSSLKGAKSPQPVEARIPVFTPRPQQAAPISLGVWVAATLVLASLAVASFSITKYVTKAPPAVPKVEPVILDPPKPKNETVYTPREMPPQQQPLQNPNSIQQPQVNQYDNQEQRKTLKLSNTSLKAALKMIGEMAGYRVEVAPGFDDQQVSIDYEGFTTSDMFKDMGQRYGFTPFDQGDGTIIIVPAVDDGGTPHNTNGSHRRFGG